MASLLLFALTLCSEGAVVSFSDPAGDTFGSPSVSHDVVSIQTIATATEIAFTVTFSDNIAPASAFDVLSVTGFIDIDTDQDAGTGGVASDGVSTSNQTAFGQGASGLGIEFYLDLFSEAFNPGFVDLIDALTGLPVVVDPTTLEPAAAAIVFSTTSFSVTVPTAWLGGDDGNVNYGVIVGDFRDVSDEATNPDQAVAYSRVGAVAAVPEPTGLMIWCSLAVGSIIARRRWPTQRRCAR